MSVAVRIDMVGGVERRIGRIIRRVEDPTPVARDLGARLVRSWELAFPRTPGHEPSEPGQPPAIQGGDMAASNTFEVRGGGAVLEAGSPLRYAGILHTGGTIRPRHKRALTVPVAPEAYGKRARDFRGVELVYIPVDGGPSGRCKAVLARRRPDGEIEPLFALVGRVTLPARPWLLIRDADWTYLAERLERRYGEG